MIMLTKKEKVEQALLEGDNVSGRILDIRTCALCGADVEIKHKSRLTLERVWCSRKCNDEWIKQQNLNCKCPVCNTMFHAKPSQIKKAKQPLTCSRKCLGKQRQIIYKGEKNPNYGNSGFKNSMFEPIRERDGYLFEYAPNHPFAEKSEHYRLRQHRLIAEKYLLTEENSIEIEGKRYLKSEYDVHHIDLNKKNNNPNNLMVLTRSEHKKLHHKLIRDLKATESK